MKMLLSGLCAALLLAASTAEAAKTHKTPHIPVKPAACPVRLSVPLPASPLTVEQGVSVYRAAPRPWRSESAPPSEPVAVKPVVVVVREHYHYLAVDTRSRGEWGPMYAVYQKF